MEAVTSVGNMSPTRVIELNDMTKKLDVGKVLIIAFLDFSSYKKIC